MSLLSPEDWALVEKIDCNACPDKSMCDQVRYDCPKIDFQRGTIDGMELDTPPKSVKRILHAKDSVTKSAFFRSEIINCLKKGEKVAVVNMPEFASMKDSRITYANVDDIGAISACMTAFIFEVYPCDALLEALKKLDCKEVYVTVPDFSSAVMDVFINAGFKAFYIIDQYIADHPPFGSLEELNAAVLKTLS